MKPGHNSKQTSDLGLKKEDLKSQASPPPDTLKREQRAPEPTKNQEPGTTNPTSPEPTMNQEPGTKNPTPPESPKGFTPTPTAIAFRVAESGGALTAEQAETILRAESEK